MVPRQEGSLEGGLGAVRWSSLPFTLGLCPMAPLVAAESHAPTLRFLGGVSSVVQLAAPLGGPSPQLPASQTFLTCPFLFQIPRIYWDLSTKRVLLMEFVDGGQVNDRDYMERNMIDVNEVRLSAHSGCAGDTGAVGAAQQG